MPYVQRDGSNAVSGVYAVAQPGLAEEWLEDDHTDVVAFRNPPAPPPELAPWQFRAMLKISGKEAALMAYFNALPQQQQIIAKAKLEYTLSFRRKNPLVLAAQQALGLSDAELDALWAQAAALT